MSVIVSVMCECVFRRQQFVGSAAKVFERVLCQRQQAHENKTPQHTCCAGERALAVFTSPCDYEYICRTKTLLTEGHCYRSSSIYVEPKLFSRKGTATAAAAAVQVAIRRGRASAPENTQPSASSHVMQEGCW